MYVAQFKTTTTYNCVKVFLQFIIYCYYLTEPASTRCHYCSHSFIPGVDKVRLVPKLRKTAHIARIERNIKIKGRSSQCPRRLNIWDHWNRTRAKLVSDSTFPTFKIVYKYIRTKYLLILM